jgi:diguanylate cyclase (GGDEF)-like protein/PAS domain S-box-containing protein
MQEVNTEKQSGGPAIGMLLTDKLSKVLEAADLHITAMFMEMTEEFGQVGFWRFDPRRDKHSWSGQVYKICGMKPYEATIDSEGVLQMFHQEDRVMARDCIEGALTHGREFKVEVRIVRPDGTLRYVKFAGKPFTNAEGVVWEVFGILVDITDYKTAEAEWRHLAETDELTGVFKLRRFEDLLQNEIRRCARSGRSTSIALIDLDEFKEVNDTYGHMVGNEVLQLFVNKLRGALRDIDVIARIGGDEFALLLPETPTHQTLEPISRIASRLRSVEVDNGKHDIAVSFCGGVVSITPESTVADTLRLADSYLYAAKKNGKHRLVSEAGVYDLWRPSQEDDDNGGPSSRQLFS